MNNTEQMQEQMVALVREKAVSFPYPPTPDIAGQVRRRLTSPPRPRQTRLAWALALLLIIMGLLIAVPQVRAAVFEIIRAGAITIFVGEPTATAIPTTPDLEEGSALPSLETAVSEIAGLSTLEDAQAQAGFLLRQPPAYGPPDEVYLEKIPDPGLDGQVVIMVWLNPVQPERVRLRLHQISMASYGLKMASLEAVALTEVRGQTAYWIEGEHRILLQNGQSYFVANNVLIWVKEDVTYRLESEMSLVEAVQVAESLKPVREEE